MTSNTMPPVLIGDASEARVSTEEEPNPTRPTEPRISFRIKLAFGLPMLFAGGMVSMMLNWLAYFYADVLKAGAAMMAPATICIVGVYAMIQPIVGFLSDNCPENLWFCVAGMRRPFLLALCFPAALGHALSFHPPHVDDPKGEGLMVYFGWLLASGCMASASVGGIEVMLQSLPPILAKSYDQRSELAGVDAASYGVGFASAPLLPALLNTLASSSGVSLSDSMGAKLQGVSVFFSVGIFLSTLFAVFTIKEPDVFRCVQPVPAGSGGCRGWLKRRLGGLRSLSTYPTLVFLAYYVSTLSGTAMAATMVPFFSKFNLRSEAALVWGPALTTLGSLLTVPLWLKILYRREKRSVLLISLFVMVTACVIGLFIPDGEAGVPVFFVAVAVLSLGVGGYTCSPSAMKPDICDYDELRSQRRREGRLLALWLCSGRLFTAVGLGLVMSLLALADFDPDEVIQKASVLTSVRLLTFGPALVAYTIAFFVIRKYPIRRSTLEQIQTSIEECKKGSIDVPDPLRQNRFLTWSSVVLPPKQSSEEENMSNGTEMSNPMEESKVTDEASRSVATDKLKASGVDVNPEAGKASAASVDGSDKSGTIAL